MVDTYSEGSVLPGLTSKVGRVKGLNTQISRGFYSLLPSLVKFSSASAGGSSPLRAGKAGPLSS